MSNRVRPRRPAGGRWGVARFVALSMLLAAAVLPTHAEAAPKLPAQGLYDTCVPEQSRDGCASRLRLISDAGFKVVQNMGVASVPENLPNIIAYANTARAHGLQVIWNLSRDLSDADLATLVGALRGHPSTWGYYIFDEPAPADRDEVAAIAAKVKTLDPTHQRLIMGCGNCYGGEGSVDFTADIDATLGTDIYPVWEQAPDEPIVAQKVWAAAAGLRAVADRAGRQTVMALQAWRWGDSHYDSQASGIGQASRFPTRREIEMQRDAAIAGGDPDLILWFTLNQVIGWEPGQRPWYWAEPPDPGARWSNLVGGAFAPPPAERSANRRPVARFTLGSSPINGTARVLANGRRSYDPDGRIVRYRWYVSGIRQPVCTTPRCSLTLRGARRHRLKLVVTDSYGARSSRVREIPGRSR